MNILLLVRTSVTFCFALLCLPTISQINNNISAKAAEANVLIEKGTEDFNNGEFDSAIEKIKMAVELNPVDSNYSALGYAYTLVDDYTNAQIALDKAVTLNPSSARTYIFRGMLYRRQQKFDMAIADFTRGIELEPEEPTPVYAQTRCIQKYRRF